MKRKFVKLKICDGSKNVENMFRYIYTKRAECYALECLKELSSEKMHFFFTNFSIASSIHSMSEHIIRHCIKKNIIKYQVRSNSRSILAYDNIYIEKLNIYGSIILQQTIKILICEQKIIIF